MADQPIVSIDLETLATVSKAVILEIGITVGDSKGNVLDQLQLFPSIDEQIADGRIISGETILWWMGSDLQQARDNQRLARRTNLLVTMEALGEFFGKYHNAKFVLGNAPSFDCEILADFMGYKPWPFYIERDVRTARMKVPADKRIDNSKAHNGLADSHAQYLDFVTFLNS